MVLQIGYITVDGKDYPVLMSADGLYRITETGEAIKIYVSKSEIHN